MIPFGVDQATIIIGNLALTLKYPDRFPIIYRDRSQRPEDPKTRTITTIVKAPGFPSPSFNGFDFIRL